jgi:uncharacterized protein (TIGR02687 family)
LRKKKHFKDFFAAHYEMLEAAYVIVSAAHYCPPEYFEGILDAYTKTDYHIDASYRRFYIAFDRLEDASDYELLRRRTEDIYTNEYLGKLLPAWSASLDIKTLAQNENSQLRFFNQNIKYAKEKTAIIISDAFRYDVAMELFAELEAYQNCHAKMKYLLAVPPTYTRLGMAALLPHRSLELKKDGAVLIDGKPSETTEKRETVLQAALPKSRCVLADTMPINKVELREEITNGMDAVYIYHDQIDKRGSSSENEVFTACLEAVNEIYTLIKRLSRSANVTRFFITADHGFLYKRDKFTQSDKINIDGLENAFINRRFIIADNGVNADGVASFPLADIIGGEDTRVVSFPIGANVFKTQGGLNYVHGGISPQEMILPLIAVKTERGHIDTSPVKIALVSIVQKITNLITQLDFIHQEPVDDLLKPAEYKLYFLSEQDGKISNENFYRADKKDKDPNKRMFRLRFTFKNKKYNPTNKYWLVAERIMDEKNADKDKKTTVELFRRQIIIDIAFADDFGF